jgi:hypothetical protein
MAGLAIRHVLRDPPKGGVKRGAPLAPRNTLSGRAADLFASSQPAPGTSGESRGVAGASAAIPARS